MHPPAPRRCAAQNQYSDSNDNNNINTKIDELHLSIRIMVQCILIMMMTNIFNVYAMIMKAGAVLSGTSAATVALRSTRVLIIVF